MASSAHAVEAAPAASGAKAKAGGISHTLNYMRKSRGEEFYQRVLARLSPVARTVLTGTLLPSTWLPVEPIGELVEAMQAELGDADSEALFSLSLETAKASYNKLYRLFFSIGLPDFVVSRTPAVWKTFMSVGDLEAVEKAKGLVVLRLSNFHFVNTAFCGHRLRAYFQAPLELSGCKMVESTHFTCVGRGDPYCQWRFRWTM